jgi:iron-sulfur cluster repair protein YtfE (RIC family)
MTAVDRLRRDHKTLRAKLDVLESALRMGPNAWFVLREVCFTLAKQLRDHMKREEELVSLCRRRMPPHVVAEVVVEHRDEPAHLRTINHLFVSESGHSMERIKPALTAVIDGLRHHMAEEEAELFPILERAIEGRFPRPTAVSASTTRLDEAMTVNRLVQEFPRTKPVFERFFINIPMEGCNCLDEVAWTHGMETNEMLKQLEASIASDASVDQSAEHAMMGASDHPAEAPPGGVHAA